MNEQVFAIGSDGIRQIFTHWNPRHNYLRVVWRQIRSHSALQAMKSYYLAQSCMQRS